MSGVQVLILIAGALLFTVSFFIPEQNSNGKEIREKEEKAVKEILEKELSQIQNRVDDALAVSLEHAKESSERAMDRLTNEKMMAVNEYSSTVLDEIHKNHEEAVFLYDMLNHKHEQLKMTFAELNQTVRSMRQKSSLVEMKEEKKSAETEERSALQNEVVKPIYTKEGVLSKTGSQPSKIQAENLKEIGKEKLRENAVKTKKGYSAKSKKMEKNVQVVLGADQDDSNNNSEILKLHKAGKSNMAIARELGLGLGEVKLVIDLFEGGM